MERKYKNDFLERIDNEISKTGNPICPYCEEEILPDQPGVFDGEDFLHISCEAEDLDGMLLDRDFGDS